MREPGRMSESPPHRGQQTKLGGDTFFSDGPVVYKLQFGQEDNVLTPWHAR